MEDQSEPATTGYGKTDDLTKRILRLLEEHDGYIAANDKTSPELIKKLFSCSKKAFKLSIGRLYKERTIDIEERGIRLLDKN